MRLNRFGKKRAESGGLVAGRPGASAPGRYNRASLYHSSICPCEDDALLARVAADDAASILLILIERDATRCRLGFSFDLRFAGSVAAPMRERPARVRRGAVGELVIRVDFSGVVMQHLGCAREEIRLNLDQER